MFSAPYYSLPGHSGVGSPYISKAEGGSSLNPSQCAAQEADSPKQPSPKSLTSAPSKLNFWI
jgi:hypothetical protein